jgi:N-acetylneuraminic acid mutarotase
MRTGRVGHRATALADGRVLVTGGYGVASINVLASAEVYDPPTDSWSVAGSMAESRWAHLAMTLRDGRVLVVAGFAPVLARTSAETFDPVTGTWSPAGSLPFVLADHAGVALIDGRALVIGGRTLRGCCSAATAAVHIYDPAGNGWSPGPPLASVRQQHTATRLGDGRVVVAGGSSDHGLLKRIDLFDPGTDSWQAVEDPWTIVP